MGCDKWHWAGGGGNSFSIKVIRLVIDASRGSMVTPFIGVNWIPLKVNCFAWKMLKNRIPTLINIFQEGGYRFFNSLSLRSLT